MGRRRNEKTEEKGRGSDFGFPLLRGVGVGRFWILGGVGYNA
jgi:hypothetical protein